MERPINYDPVKEQKNSKDRPLKRYTKTALKYSRAALLSGLALSTLVKDQEFQPQEKSFEELVIRARQELNGKGITSEQRAAYFPLANNLLSKYVYPFGYRSQFNNYDLGIGKYIIPIGKIADIFMIGRIKPQSSASFDREDAWRLYLGL